MPQFRNISPEDLMVPVGNRWVKVPVGGVIDVPNPTTYYQTGEQGEVALFEVVGKTASKAKAKGSESNDEEGK